MDSFHFSQTHEILLSPTTAMKKSYLHLSRYLWTYLCSLSHSFVKMISWRCVWDGWYRYKKTDRAVHLSAVRTRPSRLDSGDSSRGAMSSFLWGVSMETTAIAAGRFSPTKPPSIPFPHSTFVHWNIRACTCHTYTHTHTVTFTHTFTRTHTGDLEVCAHTGGGVGWGEGQVHTDFLHVLCWSCSTGNKPSISTRTAEKKACEGTSTNELDLE